MFFAPNVRAGVGLCWFARPASGGQPARKELLAEVKSVVAACRKKGQ